MSPGARRITYSQCCPFMMPHDPAHVCLCVVSLAERALGTTGMRRRSHRCTLQGLVHLLSASSAPPPLQAVRTDKQTPGPRWEGGGTHTWNTYNSSIRHSEFTLQNSCVKLENKVVKCIQYYEKMTALKHANYFKEYTIIVTYSRWFPPHCYWLWD